IIEKIRKAMPGAALSTDIIVGFCSESLEDHIQTMEVMREVEYEGAYMFNYSPRPNTKAFDTLADDVPDEEKSRRLAQIIAMQNKIAEQKNLIETGCEHTILVEGRSKKNENDWKGRTDTNKTVVFPRADAEIGEYRKVRILRSNSATLIGELSDVKATKTPAAPTQDRGEVLYDLSPFVISSVPHGEHSGIEQQAAMLPIIQ
ncbi:MAG: TRAM domain-containing protein, partial [Ignavibacteriota bacterium]